MTVKNTGTTPILGRVVHFTLPGGQSPASVWNGVSTGTGTAATVDNADWNGSLAVGASTTFGFVADGGAPDPAAGYSRTVM